VKGEPGAKLTGFWVEYRAEVASKTKKVSALALSPSYQAELTGSLSLYHSELTTGKKTDGFLAVVCSKLAFHGSGSYLSAFHYKG
jgi:hypothetical protein